MTEKTFKTTILSVVFLVIVAYAGVTTYTQTTHVEAYAKQEASPLEQKINGKVARVRNVVKMLLSEISEEKQTPELLSTVFSIAYSIVSDSDEGPDYQRPSAWGGSIFPYDGQIHGAEIDAGTLVAGTDTGYSLSGDGPPTYAYISACAGTDHLFYVNTSEAAPAYCAVYKIEDPRAPGGVTYQPLIGATLDRIRDQLTHYDVDPGNLVGCWELKDSAKVHVGEATDAPAESPKTIKKWKKP